jgi:hypothetical protein
MATRLFRSIVVFGTTIGAAAALGPGCDLSGGDGGDDDDESDVDAWFGIIDAPTPYWDAAPDADWGIIDAPLPDAAPDAEPPPDAVEDP